MNKCVSVCCLLLNVYLGAATPSKEAHLCRHCEQGISNTRVNVVKKCRNAVVYIETKQEPSMDRGFVIDPFEQFFGMPRRREQAPSQNFSPSGTGFIVSSDGYIVTNNHVIDKAEEIKVEILSDSGEKEYQAKLIGCDPRSDIAILKIEEKGLPFLEFGDSDSVEEGQSTIAIGHPYRLRHSITGGMISAKDRTDLDLTDRAEYIQTDAALNPGSSGGPLLNLDGKVIAVNTAIRVQSNGLGFAIPSNMAKMVYEHVKATGSVDRGFLGISLQDLSEDLIEAFGYNKGTKGALVTSVEKDLAGAVAGLETGDLITAFNGVRVKDAKALIIAVGKLASGKKCKMKVMRGNKEIELKAELGSQIAAASTKNNIMQRLGIVVDSKNDSEKGVCIKEIIPGGLAHRSGWKVGSHILELNGQKIETVDDIVAAFDKNKDGKKLIALLEHNGAKLFTTITTN